MQPDQRFEHVVSLIRKGEFGWADFFEPVMDSITSGGDYYLLANDFPSYIDAQVLRRFPRPLTLTAFAGSNSGPVQYMPSSLACPHLPCN